MNIPTNVRMKMNARTFIKSLAVTIAVITVTAPFITAQTNFAGGLYFNAGFPQGDFKDQIDRNAYGLSGQFFYSPKRSPLAVGFELGWMNYGNESRREPFSTTIPDVTVEVTTSNNIVQGFFIVRGQVPNGPIRIYGDALVGLNYLFTETKISDADGGEEVASSTNQDDGVFAYGFGGGLQIPVYSGLVGEKQKAIEVILDAGLRYVFGGEAEYLKEGSIRRENGTVTYDIIKSKTDMLRLHIGVMMRF